MGIRKTAFVPNEFFHIYNRGNSKQQIFHDRQDYTRFLKLLYLCNCKANFKIQALEGKNIYDVERVEKLVGIGAYCLMPNHFHLLIAQMPEGSISKFMQKLTTGYSMYYNQKYKRTGTLFEGKFKAEHANSDRYLKYLFSYIHLNPVKLIDSTWKESGIKDILATKKYLNTYEFSSYKDYINHNRPETSILSKEIFPDYFSSKDVFEKEIFEWLHYRQDL